MSLCQVCLGGDGIMLIIEDNRLLEVYKKLTKCELNRPGGKPSTICCKCISELQICYLLSAMARKSPNTSTHIHHGKEVTNNVCVLNPAEPHLSNSLHITAALPPVTSSQELVEQELVGVEQEQVAVQEELTEEEELMKIVKKEPGVEESMLVNDNDVINKITEHITTEKSVDLNSYVCHRCKKKCSLNGVICLRLKNIGTGEEVNICNKCSKELKKYGAKPTTSMLSGVHPHYSCGICNKEFSNSDDVNTHILVHNIHIGDKPYSCNECSRTFTRLGILKTTWTCTKISLMSAIFAVRALTMVTV